MGIAFGSYSRDSERNGEEYVEVEVEVDRTHENFKKKMKEIKEFVENIGKIKENISLKYFYVTNDDDIAEKFDKETEQDKRNFISGNYFLDREEAEKFIDTNRYKHRFWIADNDAKERMARIEKKIQQIKEQESFFPEIAGIVDESEMVPEIEDLELEPEFDDEPIMDEPVMKPKIYTKIAFWAIFMLLNFWRKNDKIKLSKIM